MPSELELYKRNQKALVAKYAGKILALRHGEVQGVYDSKVDALAAMKERFAPGDFMIIKCTPGDEEYTRRFRSRVLYGSVVTA